MRSVSIAELEATLSEQVRHVRTGEVVLVTDRGHPVARLMPFVSPNVMDEDARILALEHRGDVRRPPLPISPELLTLPSGTDSDNSVRLAVCEERAAGW